MSASYIILTDDLGLIRARAQGIRRVKSRLKGALQEFSLSVISFVHGRSGWKITTAISARNFFTEVKDIQARKIMAHISDLLIHLITGEEKNAEIFSAVKNGFLSLTDGGKNIHNIEAVILTRVLHSLGYVASNENIAILLKDFADFSPPVLSHASTHKASIVLVINKGLKESQL